MLSAKALKQLEIEGFEIIFQSEPKEKIFLEVFQENNPRLDLALPLLLADSNFNYKILEKIKENKLKKILAITKNIFEEEGIINENFSKICQKIGLHPYTKEEKEYFHSHFIEFQKNKEAREKLHIDIKAKIELNKDIAKLFAPGKRKILQKISNYEPLTNTELKYYYRAIRPLIKTLLSEEIRNYAKAIDSIKPIKG